jgi:hypothetical protein
VISNQGQILVEMVEEVEKNLGEVLWSSFNGPHEIFRALRTYPLKIYYYACTQAFWQAYVKK